MHGHLPNPKFQITHTYRDMALSLPYANVDSSLRALAGQAEGFGRFAIGGLHGPLYHVTTLAGKLRRHKYQIASYYLSFLSHGIILFNFIKLL